MDNNERIKEILKTMVAFDVENDIEDEEKREQLINLFSEIVGFSDDLSKSFLIKLFDHMTDILVEMGLVQKSEEDGEEEPKEEPEEVDVSEQYALAERANDYIME